MEVHSYGSILVISLEGEVLATIAAHDLASTGRPDPGLEDLQFTTCDEAARPKLRP